MATKTHTAPIATAGAATKATAEATNESFRLKPDAPKPEKTRNTIPKFDPSLPVDDQPITSPFTILVDTGEQQPWTFQGIRADSRQDRRRDVQPEDRRPLIVPTQRQYLGKAQGDYQIAGMERRASVERKSMEDAQTTVLSWGDRNNAWQRELESLNEMEAAAIIVEATIGDVLTEMPDWGKRSVSEKRKSFTRQLLAWQQDFPRIAWIFADSRGLAEVLAFRFLERFHRKHAGKD